MSFLKAIVLSAKLNYAKVRALPVLTGLTIFGRPIFLSKVPLKEVSLCFVSTELKKLIRARSRPKESCLIALIKSEGTEYHLYFSLNFIKKLSCSCSIQPLKATVKLTC